MALGIPRGLCLCLGKRKFDLLDLGSRAGGNSKRVLVICPAMVVLDIPAALPRHSSRGVQL
jgi:hypothetical protein